MTAPRIEGKSSFLVRHRKRCNLSPTQPTLGEYTSGEVGLQRFVLDFGGSRFLRVQQKCEYLQIIP